MSATSGAHLYLVLMLTVYLSTTLTLLIAASMNSQPPLVLRAASIENLTSAEVISPPEWNLTPLRSLNV